MTRTRSIKHRAAIALGLAVFLVLAGTGTSFALWNATATSSATVTAGRIAVTQTGFPSVGHAFSRTSPTGTGAVTIANAGDFTAPYAARITTGASGLAAAIAVDAWLKTPQNDCTVPAPGTVSGTLALMPPLTGSLAAGASATYCVRTTLSPSALTANSNSSLSAALTVTSTLGSWTATAVASAAMTVGDTAPPTVPGTPMALSTTLTSISLVWTASSDDIGVSGYDLFRDGVLVASVASLTYTDTSTVAGTSYRYTVVARDAAGNTSGASAALSVTATKQMTGYQVRYAAGTLCVGAPDLTEGAQIVVSTCDQPVTKKNQAWQFLPNGDGSFTVQPVQGQNLDWSVNGTNPVSLFRQIVPGPGWIVSPVGAAGEYHFIAASSGQCLAARLAATAPGTLLGQEPCGSGAGQVFTLTAVP